MSNLRKFSPVILLVWLTFNATAEDYIVPDGVTVLTEEQLLDRVVGNTSYTYNWDEYYRPSADGNLQGELQIRHHKYGLVGGSWKINGSLFCTSYDKKPMSFHGFCYTMALDGDKATYYKTDGSIWYSKGGTIRLKKGNPNNF